MIFDTEGHTTVVFQEKVSLAVFLKNLEEAYPRFKHNNLILNLFSFDALRPADLLEFLDISNRHRGAGKSLVLVYDGVSYEDVPDELCLVPTLQEARDVIEMEDIERDLDL
ncbi:ribonuclease Z [Robiginitalea sp. M366]|uniref:ribonuclease Z n=1 Tax=Robiginitalea aestuariiviva TaxID=3036903 RepID=UPI00240E1A64|nr:ribonuclease Z [Robiginitalea aestuariiviva]MDG1572605.1 ribonuclease Z [Robiginitalea aestuariiviva]